MLDWVTISSLATAGGTLVLALATFASVRSANQAARTAEHALSVGLRPVLMPSRRGDPDEKVVWGDRHAAKVPGGKAAVDVGDDGAIYLAMSLRNVGAGIAVLHGWHVTPERIEATSPRPQPDEFRRQVLDLYVPAGGVGYWQAGLRDPAEEIHPTLLRTIHASDPFTIDILYSDHDGGQRTITRFGLRQQEDLTWICPVLRHWNLDRGDPR